MPSKVFAGAPESIRGNLPRVEIRIGRATDIDAVLDFWRVATVEPSVTGDAAGLANTLVAGRDRGTVQKYTRRPSTSSV